MAQLNLPEIEKEIQQYWKGKIRKIQQYWKYWKDKIMKILKYLKDNRTAILLASFITIGFMGYTRAVSGAEFEFNFTFTLIQTSVTIAGLTFLAKDEKRKVELMESSQRFIIAALLFLFKLSALSIPDLVQNTPLEFINIPFPHYPIMVFVGAVCFLAGIFLFNYGLIKLYFIASGIIKSMKDSKA